MLEPLLHNVIDRTRGIDQGVVRLRVIALTYYREGEDGVEKLGLELLCNCELLRRDNVCCGTHWLYCATMPLR